MKVARVNLVLAVLLMITALFAAAVDTDRTRPNLEFLPEMKRSPAFDAFAPNPQFSNGRTMQTPVVGTIARGQLPLHFAATKEDAERAGDELINPFTTAGAQGSSSDNDETREADALAALDVSIREGARLYGVFCVSCHGPSGAGDGPVAKRGFPPPPSLTTGKSGQMKDGQLFHILTWGQGSMAPMAGQLRRDQRWDVVNYIRSMQQGAKQAAALGAAGTDASDASHEEEDDQP